MKYRIALKWGILFAGVLLIGTPMFAQQKSKSKKEEIVISKKEKKEKLTIIVDGDNVTVNGKPIDQYNGDDIVIRKRGRNEFEFNDDHFTFSAPRITPTPYVYATPPMPPPRVYGVPRNNWKYSYDYNNDESSKKAILGITTEDDAKGAKIKEVLKESAAEKAGLKAGDIITQVDGKKVEDAEALSDIIDDKDPGDQVELTYLRDKKTQKVKVKLGERKQSHSRTYRAPRIEGLEGLNKMEPFNFSFGPDRHRLGIRIQELDDSSGVKVLEVEDESLAEKAGVKRDDVITEIDGNKVKDTYSARDAMADSRSKSNFTIKVLRGGSTVNLEVKIPKVLKKADL